MDGKRESTKKVGINHVSMDNSSINNVQISASNLDGGDVGISNMQMKDSQIANVQISETTTLSNDQTVELLGYGLSEDQIEQLKQILLKNRNDKAEQKKKTMEWFSSIVSNLVASAIYDSIPSVYSFLTKLFV